MPEEKQGFSRQIINGLFWVACGKGMQTFLKFLVLVILARLISPHDFGVITAAMVIVDFSEIITELGFAPAIVQRENLEERHLATAFSSSLIFGCSTGLLIYLSAPFLAGFFNSLQIEEVLKVLALIFPIKSFGTIGDALAQREMRFRWLATRDAISFFTGYFIFGIGLAELGYGVWALVAANMVTAAMKTFLLLYSYPPKTFLPERRAFRELFYFGSGHTFARLSNYLALQGDNLVVARSLGLSLLGIYGRSYQLMSVPATLFGQILDSVLFPTMAKMQSQKERLAVAYLKGVNVIAIVMLPASIIGIILAPEIVRVILGVQWSKAILPLQILLIGLLMRTSYKMSDSLARATGAVYSRAWRQLLYAAAVIAGAWVGHFWKLPGVACGVLAAVTFNFLVMGQLSLKRIDRNWNDFLAAHKQAFVLTGFTALVVYPTVFLLRYAHFKPVSVLSLTTITTLLIGITAIRIAPRFLLGADGLELIYILQSYLPQSFRTVILRESANLSKPIGVENASIKNI